MTDKFSPSPKSGKRMDRGLVGWLSQITPKVRRPYLFGLSGILWTVAGGILCMRGTIWLETLQLDAALTLLALSLLIEGPAYLFGFSKIVRRNMDRIIGMPERANVFAFTAPRGYLMIGMMIAVGITLRNSALPKYYLIVPYYAMGGVLLVGSTKFYRACIAALSGTSSEDLRQ